MEDVHEFGRQFEAWFSNISKREDVLRVGGPNGFPIVMLLLCRWGRAVHSENGVTDEGDWVAWNNMVTSVIDTLDVLAGRVVQRREAPLPVDTPVPKRYVVLL